MMISWLFVSSVPAAFTSFPAPTVYSEVRFSKVLISALVDRDKTATSSSPRAMPVNGHVGFSCRTVRQRGFEEAARQLILSYGIFSDIATI
jgi:hypothetical protein